MEEQKVNEMKPMIYQAISKVMEDVGAVGKNDKNPQQGYKYRGIDAVMNALHPAMTKHGVMAIPTVLNYEREERAGRQGGTLIYSVATVQYNFYAEDGSYVSAIVIGEAMDSGDKSMNKAMSAAYKYACFQTFCIPTEELIDSERDTYEVESKNKKSASAEVKTFKKAGTDELPPAKEEKTEKKLTAAGKKLILDKCQTKGVGEATILAWCHLKSLDDMNVEQYKSVMKKLDETEDFKPAKEENK